MQGKGYPNVFLFCLSAPGKLMQFAGWLACEYDKGLNFEQGEREKKQSDLR